MITAESHAQGVRITVDVPAGQEWTVTRSDGFPVRGGAGVGPATFLDVAAPVNEPVTYLIDPPTWVEVGRNLAVRPYSTASNNTQDARVLKSMTGWGAGNAAPAYTIVPDEDTATGFATAGVAVADGKTNPGGDLLVCNLHIPATVGETYSTRMRIKATFDVDIRLQFQLLNATNGSTGTVDGVVTPLRAGEWTEVSLEGATIPAGDTTKVRIDIDAGSASQFTAEDKIMVDTLSFQQGNTAVLFSGDHAPEGMRSEWLGEPNNSVSVLLAEQSSATAIRKADGHLLTSLNGLTQANFRWLGDGDMPVEPRMYQADVPGRTRPVLRLQPVAADGGISVTARVAGEVNRVMRSLLLANRPMLLFHDRSKCEIPECDIPAVSCVFPASPASNPRTGHVRVATRDWILEFLTIDVPGLASRVGIGVWEQLEAEQIVWADVEALTMAWSDFENGGWINE